LDLPVHFGGASCKLTPWPTSWSEPPYRHHTSSTRLLTTRSSCSTSKAACSLGTKGARRIKGYEAREIIGQPYATFFRKSDRPDCERALKTAAETGRYVSEGVRVRKDGSELWASVVLTALHQDGRLVGFAKIARDLTEQRRAQENERRLWVERELGREKDEFLGTLSHELRTPMNAVLLWVDVLLAPPNTTRGLPFALELARLSRFFQSVTAVVRMSPRPETSTRRAAPSVKHLQRALWLLPLAVACRTSKPAEPPIQHPAAVEVSQPEPPPESGLYAADEALRDALSGELEYLGTGRWPGIERSRACVFRNRRVFVVNVYCTLTETQAFRIDVYSPERGRVRIYAEANGRLSARSRSDYFTFTVEGGPPPDPHVRLPPVALSMSYQELRLYEQQRYDALVPGCFVGEQHARKIGGCLGALASRENEWAARNQAFLERGSDDWYRVIRQMRALAERYGHDPI
jgi:PAS domain S-box-containing protein